MCHCIRHLGTCRNIFQRRSTPIQVLGPDQDSSWSIEKTKPYQGRDIDRSFFYNNAGDDANKAREEYANGPAKIAVDWDCMSGFSNSAEDSSSDMEPSEIDSSDFASAFYKTLQPRLPPKRASSVKALPGQAGHRKFESRRKAEELAPKIRKEDTGRLRAREGEVGSPKMATPVPTPTGSLNPSYSSTLAPDGQPIPDPQPPLYPAPAGVRKLISLVTAQDVRLARNPYKIYDPITDPGDRPMPKLTGLNGRLTNKDVAVWKIVNRYPEHGRE